MSNSPLLLTSEALAGVRDGAGRMRERAAERIAPYAADPMLALNEGLISVFDRDLMRAVPFRPWPHQIEALKAWITDAFLAGEGPLGNLHIEKSRQMGDTWLFVFACLWLLTYRDAPLLMSHERLDEVADSGMTIDSFWGKVKFMWERWPEAIGKARLEFVGGNKPVIYDKDSQHSFLVGHGGRPDLGRGGSFVGALIDEAARMRFDREANRALVAACPHGRVMLSTPNGEGNVYFRLREDRPLGWTFLRHHWSQHPVYGEGAHVAGEDPDCARCEGVRNGIPWTADSDDSHRYPGKLTSPWYDMAVCNLPDDSDVAQELDIDYTASVVGRVYPEFSEDIHVAEQVLPYVRGLPLFLGWDYGIGDPTSIVICQEIPEEFRILADVEMRDAVPETIVEVLNAVLDALGVPKTARQDEWLFSVGDPSGVNRTPVTGTSLFEAYARLGYPTAPSSASPADRINAVKRLLLGRPKPVVFSPRASDAIRHVKLLHFPLDARGVRKPEAKKPDHDEHSHMGDALGYLIGHKWPPASTGDGIAEATRKVREVRDHLDDADDSGLVDRGVAGMEY